MEQHDNGTRKDLVKYRIRSAKEDLKSAQILLEAGSLKAANNRAYYAIFHAINAIHALHGAGYKRHKDAIANFNKEYVKTEIFQEKLEGEFQKQRKSGMPVIMTTFTSQPLMRQKGR